MHVDLGRRLVEERERLVISQGDLCKLTNVKRRTQFNYEQGSSSPDANYLISLIEHGFDVPYLLTGVRSARQGALDVKLLREVFSALDLALHAVSGSLDPDRKAKLFALVYQTAGRSESY
jgi:transcriptional regulator with XRE-family HTH domain